MKGLARRVANLETLSAMSNMNLTEREQFYYGRAFKDTGLRKEVFRYQALKVVVLLMIFASLIWTIPWVGTFSLLAIYGVATLWETERCRRAAIAYRSVIRKLGQAAEARSAHGR